MPKTKRSKVVSLTKTARKTKEDKSTLIDSVRKSADEFPYIWLFSIGNMRNNYLKEVRDLWKGSRIYFGKNRVMARALGESREEEIKSGVSALAQRLSGSVGLLFTDSPPTEVADWFDTHERKDYARSGNVATSTIVLPEGPILTRSEPAETLAGPIEPQLRKLGLPTELKRGVPTLRQEFTVCRQGKRIDANAAQILKHLVVQQASFRIVPLAYYDSAKEAIVELELTADQLSLVHQANGKDSESVPGARRSVRATKRVTQSNGGAAGEDMAEDDEEVDSDDDDDDEEMSESGGDRVTESMMLPAHLR